MQHEKIPFTIRFAQPGDEGAIVSLIRQLAEYEHMEDQVVATEALVHDWLFVSRRGETLICEAEGKVAGFALFFYNFSTFLGRSGIYLEDLFVLPEMRGHGMGKAMLRRLAQIAKERGCGRLEWSCLDWNEPSIQFYRSIGAVPMDEWTVYRLTEEAFTRLAEEEK